MVGVFQDGAIFHHWRRKADEGKDYPFGRFNKVMTKGNLSNQNIPPGYMVWQTGRKGQILTAKTSGNLRLHSPSLPTLVVVTGLT